MPRTTIYTNLHRPVVSVHICVYRAEAIMQQYVHHQLTNFASQRLCKTWQSARASLSWATDSKLWKGFVFKGFLQSFIFFLWTWDRLQRWSFFYNDGMVMFFFQGTIVIDGFSMVLPSLDHYHWMFFADQPLKLMVFRWFSQIQVRWSAMVLTSKKT